MYRPIHLDRRPGRGRGPSRGGDRERGRLRRPGLPRTRGRLLPGAAAAGLLLLAASLALAPDRASAQQRPGEGPASEFHASPYLPLGHWAYDILDHWIHTGRVENLSPLTRPWRRMDVARGVRRVARDRPYSYEEGWLERLREEFRRELAVLEGRAEGEAGYLRATLEAGGTYRSQTHRDPLRPELDGPFSADRLLERAFLRLDGRAGPVVGAFYTGRDGLYLEDPQFAKGRVVPEADADIIGLDELVARVEEAYVELQTEYAGLFFGRMYRDWGPPGIRGFTRSAYAYSYDELAYRLGKDRIRLVGNLASLSDFQGDTTRYFSSHRLEVRPWEELVLAVSEAAIQGGPGHPLDLSLVNPLGIWNFYDGGSSTTEEAGPVNLVGQADLWWRPVRGFAVYGSFLADATNSPSTGGVSCCQIGGMAGLGFPGLVRGWGFRLRASSIQSLAYRTELPWEEWSVDGLGLGWDKADLYLLEAEAEWLGRPGWVIRPGLAVQIRGEESRFKGRLRPPKEELPGFPRVIAGNGELTVRPSVSGRGNLVLDGGWNVDLEWDVGLNIIRDFENVASDDRTAFVGRVKTVLKTPSALLPLP